MNRREFLKDALITAAALTLGGCAPKETNTSSEPTLEELEKATTLKPEYVSALYPLSLQFEPTSPTISHDALKSALSEFLPSLDENHNIVFRFTDIGAKSDSSVSYTHVVYDFDVTKDPKTATKLSKVVTAAYLTDEQNLLELLNNQLSKSFIEHLLFYDYYMANTKITDQASDAASNAANEFLKNNGPIFTFSSLSSPLQQA